LEVCNCMSECIKVLLSVIFMYPGFKTPLPPFIDHESSNVFKETTQVMDNEGAKGCYKDLPAERTAAQKCLVLAPSNTRGTVRRGDACMYNEQH